MLWKRLNAFGTDAWRVVQLRDKWLVQGAAVFEHGRQVASLSYSVTCASDWSTRLARVSGWVGSQDVELDVRRSDLGDRMVNGDPAPRKNVTTLNEVVSQAAMVGGLLAQKDDPAIVHLSNSDLLLYVFIVRYENT